MWVLDPGNSRDLLNRLRKRWISADPLVIWCGEGWRALIEQCDAELAQAFPDYVIYQIEPKLGVLVFLVRPRPGEVTTDEIANAHAITARYRAASAATCEWCGRPGHLRENRAECQTEVQTLCDECFSDLATSHYPRARLRPQ